jgi:signal transduction histidine kinase
MWALMCDPYCIHALSEMAIAAVIGWLYWLRKKQIAGLVAAQSVRRLTGRERIAMELHDTLLQDTQGLVLMFQGLSGRLAKQHPVRAEMEVALDQADLLLERARERACEQLSIGVETDIGRGVRRLSEELWLGTRLPMSILVLGTPRPVQTGVVAEINHFARAALLYALTHAKATQIEVEVEYGRTDVRIRIRDDGSGLGTALQSETVPASRQALLAIGEPLRRSGLRLYIWSGGGAGTEVELIIDGDSAYL